MPQTQLAPASPELLAEITQFYAVQMPLLEERDLDAFAETFTEDCVFGYEGAWQIDGRAAVLAGMRGNMPRYGTATIRHWFENRRVEVREDGVVAVRATSLISITDEKGAVTFEPSCVVRDELVRTGEGLLTRSRIIRHDLPQQSIYFSLGAGHA